MTTEVRVLPTAEPPVPVSPERVTPLRPSEALRLGRLTRPRQSFHSLFNGTSGACAVGAILTGYGFEATGADNLGYTALLRHLPVESGFCTISEIISRNDSGQSDDQIVQWLESLGL